MFAVTADGHHPHPSWSMYTAYYHILEHDKTASKRPTTMQKVPDVTQCARETVNPTGDVLPLIPPPLPDHPKTVRLGHSRRPSGRYHVRYIDTYLFEV